VSPEDQKPRRRPGPRMKGFPLRCLRLAFLDYARGRPPEWWILRPHSIGDAPLDRQRPTRSAIVGNQNPSLHLEAAAPGDPRPHRTPSRADVV
jgi:hypothetical protein